MAHTQASVVCLPWHGLTTFFKVCYAAIQLRLNVRHINVCLTMSDYTFIR